MSLSYSIKKNLTFKVSHGHNKIVLNNSISINKGDMALVYIGIANLLIIDTQDELLYPDYFISSSKLTKLHPLYNWRFYFNCLIEQKYYLSYFDYSMMFYLDEQIHYEIFNFTVNFNNSNYQLNRYFNVTNNHFGDVRCFNSHKTINNTLECELLLLSQNFAHQFKVEFGNCEFSNFKVEGN